MLFFVSINDCVKDPDCGVILFADDLMLWKVIHNAADAARLQANLNRLDDWSKRWLMPFKVSFRFAHQAGRILDYQIKLWTQDSVTEGFAFNVEIVFFENEIVDLNETAFPPSLQRSGADGYVRGRPLLAGRLSDQNSIEMAPFPLPTEADRQSARGALYAWWVYPSGGDDCNDVSDPNRLSFVRFGINSYSACILRYNLSTLSNCTELEDQIKTILTRQWNSTTSTASAETPTHVGCLGASQPEVPSQWTPILFADDAMTERCTTSSGNNECANIIIGQHIRVAYAYQGKVTNPRATVLGAQIEYIRGNIKFLVRKSTVI
ncbi:hypothetical protein SprV_0301010000 [Sparganum proliferum]